MYKLVVTEKERSIGNKSAKQRKKKSKCCRRRYGKKTSRFIP